MGMQIYMQCITFGDFHISHHSTARNIVSVLTHRLTLVIQHSTASIMQSVLTHRLTLAIQHSTANIMQSVLTHRLTLAITLLQVSCSV